MHFNCVNLLQSKMDIHESLQITMQPDGSFLCFGSGKNETEILEGPMVEVIVSYFVLGQQRR